MAMCRLGPPRAGTRFIRSTVFELDAIEPVLPCILLAPYIRLLSRVLPVCKDVNGKALLATASHLERTGLDARMPGQSIETPHPTVRAGTSSEIFRDGA